MKRIVLVSIAMLIVVSSVFAMGGGETSAASEYDRIVTTTVTATYLNETWFNTMNADFEKETGIHVVVQPVPGDEDEYKAKINIDLMGGSDVDVVETLGPKDYSRQVSAGFFMPLNDAVEAAGIDPYALYEPIFLWRRMAITMHFHSSRRCIAYSTTRQSSMKQVFLIRKDHGHGMNM